MDGKKDDVEEVPFLRLGTGSLDFAREKVNNKSEIWLGYMRNYGPGHRIAAEGGGIQVDLAHVRKPRREKTWGRIRRSCWVMNF